MSEFCEINTSELTEILGLGVSAYCMPIDLHVLALLTSIFCPRTFSLQCL
jgi:hypothetical protein